MSASPYNDATALTNYIVSHYRHLMTEMERSAHFHWMRQVKLGNSTNKGQWEKLDLHLYGPPPKEAQRLLADGPELFLERVRNRILAEHPEEVILNRCEKCGALCRTPKACLCPVCNHTWYERRKE